MGQPRYRARQLFEAIYAQGRESLDAVTNLGRPLQRGLEEEGWSIGLPRISTAITAADGTLRYLVALDDGKSVETVWMPEGDGSEAADGARGWDRATICVSSQVGCAVACRFCMTALLGLERNLTAGEIVGQVLAVLRERRAQPRRQRVNLVFMGQGEPFLNYRNWIKAVRLLVEGVAIPESRMTVSTAGIVPGIEQLGREAVRPRLAISIKRRHARSRKAMTRSRS